MNHVSVIRVLALAFLGLAGAMAAPTLVGLVEGEPFLAAVFLANGMAIALLSTIVLLLTRTPERPARAADGLAVAVLIWLLAPFAAAAPFAFASPEFDVALALHEAVSNLTTTGHPVVLSAEAEWPSSIVVWRGVLHVFGGLLSLTTAASVFAALNLGGPGIHRSVLFTLPEQSFFDAVPRVVRAAAIAMALTVAVLSVGLSIQGLQPNKALSIAVGVATTGMVDPASMNQPPLPLWQSLLVFAGLAASTLGLFVGIEAAGGRIARAVRDPETLAAIAAWVGLTAAAAVAGLGVFQAAGFSISALATSGVNMTGGAPALVLPTPLLIIPALIGGSALSTAGGVKLARLAVLARRAGQEFSRLGYRDSVSSLQFRDRAQEGQTVIAVWVYLIAYVAATTAVIAILSWTGEPIETATRSAVGAITNSGWLVDEIDSRTDGLVISAAMIFGRLEVLGLLPAFAPSFWRA